MKFWHQICCRKRLIACVAVVIGLCIMSALLGAVSAHPGDTDSHGGHLDRSTGTYHYHHGYPAHQHKNGTCPYGFDDQTGRNSGTSSGVGIVNSQEEMPPKEVPEKIEETPEDPKSKGLIASAGLLWIAAAVSCNRSRSKRKKRQRDRISKIIDLDKERTKLLCKWLQEDDERWQREFRRLQKARRFAEKQKKYTSLYGGKEPEVLCGMPENVEIGQDGLPVDKGSKDCGNWGYAFTYFQTSNGKRVHKKYNCCGATIPIHAYMVRGTPECSKCCKDGHPDLRWFDKYQKIKSIKKNYHID